VPEEELGIMERRGRRDKRKRTEEKERERIRREEGKEK
jgi:hypothetical protein